MDSLLHFVCMLLGLDIHYTAVSVLKNEINNTYSVNLFTNGSTNLIQV